MELTAPTGTDAGWCVTSRKLNKENSTNCETNYLEIISKISKHKFAYRKILNKLTHGEFLQLWSKTLTIKNPQTQNKVRTRLKPYMGKIQNFTYLKNLSLRFKSIDSYNLKKIYECCKTVLTELKIPKEIVSEIKRNIRVVPIRGQSIRSVLVNSRKACKTELNVCLGSPYCTDQKHLSRRLSEINQLGEEISKVGLSYIPRQTYQDLLKETLVNLTHWIINIEATNLNSEISKKLTYKRKELPIFSGRKIQGWLSVDQYLFLKEEFLTWKSHREIDFIASLIKSSENQNNNSWIPPRPIFRAIEENCPIDFHRYTTAFTTLWKRWSSSYPGDEKLGAVSTKTTWEGTNIACPTRNKITEGLTFAINGAIKNNALSFIFLEETLVTEQSGILKKDLFIPICTWEKNKLPFTKSINAKLSLKISLYLVSRRNIDVRKLQKTLSTMTVSLTGETEAIHIHTPRTQTATTLQRKETESNNKNKKKKTGPTELEVEYIKHVLTGVGILNIIKKFVI